MGRYTLIGADGVPCASTTPGRLGGHRRNRVYGRLDCAGALRWIAKGHYVTQRVFFADEATALSAGFRPCARCLPERYAAWKRGAMTVRLDAREPFDYEHLLRFLAARAVPGVETVEEGAFRRDGFALEIDAGGATLSVEDGFVAGGASRGGDGRARQGVAGGASRRSASLAVRLAPGAIGDGVRRARAMLDLDADPAAIAAVLGGDPVLAPLVAARPGLRSPGAFDAYEVGVRAVVGQQVSVAGARTVLGRMAE